MTDFLWKRTEDGITDCFLVRNKVFVLEQGFNAETEFDNIDHTALHLCIMEDKKTVGTARLFKDSDNYHCGRICLLKEYRKNGLGQKIMKEIERKTQSLGGTILELSAQVEVLNFYKKCGFMPEGAVYLDEHCPHIKCVKNISICSE